APPQDFDAPPQDIDAPPQGFDAPPQGFDAPVQSNAEDLHPDSAATNTAHSQPTTQFVVQPPSFGEQLQSIRLEHHLTLTQLAAKAHISISAICDLESGDLTRLQTNSYYCRSWIERICAAYDPWVSPEPILEAFDRALQQHAPVEPENDLLDNSSGLAEEDTHRLSSILISAVIVLLLLLIIGGWAYKRYEISRQEKASVNYDLPSLIPPPHLPLTPLDIPTP
ncbi:MAG: helix-turn-helix domain-containing protein, partial [Victivallales bacterium]|nr:helix-turn-helix domain-containing protein [Victivallales bacterium]